MNMLTSFGFGLNIALIGANGGIGRAMVTQLSQSENVARLFALSRQPPAEVGSRVTFPPIDITHEASVGLAAQNLEGQSLDLILVTTGLLHAEGLAPEKTVRQLNSDSFEKLMAVNTLGPMLVAKHFLPLLNRQRKTAFAAISARVGSISDNRAGGWYSYRASKAALNMMLKCLSIETRMRYPQLIVAGLHPGTVETSLSEPFRRNVPPEKLFSAEQAAGYLLQVLDGLTVEDSGRVFSWDGREVTA